MEKILKILAKSNFSKNEIFESKKLIKSLTIDIVPVLLKNIKKEIMDEEGKVQFSNFKCFKLYLLQVVFYTNIDELLGNKKEIIESSTEIEKKLKGIGLIKNQTSEH